MGKYITFVDNMVITDKKAQNYVIKTVTGSIIGCLCDISNTAQHSYPFKFTRDWYRTEEDINRDKEKVDKEIEKIVFYLDNFGEYLDVKNLINDYFNRNKDNHWKSRKDLFNQYLQHIVLMRVGIELDNIPTDIC